jgi:hypothetical protein
MQRWPLPDRSSYPKRKRTGQTQVWPVFYCSSGERLCKSTVPCCIICDHQRAAAARSNTAFMPPAARGADAARGQRPTIMFINMIDNRRNNPARAPFEMLTCAFAAPRREAKHFSR